MFREQMLSLRNLDERVRNGPDDAILGSNKGVEAYDFYEAARVSVPEMYTGRVQSLVKAVTSLNAARPPRAILDLGDGSGVLAMELAVAFPGCRGVVFEHPSVADLPRRLVAERNIEQRVSVAAGDFNTDDLGGGYDLILASGVLNFAKDYLDAVMDKLYRALTPDGYLHVVTHNVQR